MSGDENKPRGTTIGGVLALLTLAVFWRLLDCDFVFFDDNLYVTGNPAVQAGLSWEGVKWAFHSTTASNWHPLTWLSHMLDCQLYGLKPLGPHYTNLLFHIANTLLLFVWLRQLTGAVWRSALVAALFAWHPLHVESVAWVSERKDVLSTFFWLLTLLTYQKFKAQGSRLNRAYALALLFFLLGLLAKPMVVTLPFVLLLVDWWTAESAINLPLSALPWTKWLVEKIPFFALSGASSVVTFLAQRHGGAVESLDRLPVTDRIANASVAYARYLEKTFWPADLAVFYPHPGFWSNGLVAGAIFLLLAITGLVLWCMRGRPWLGFGWFWFLGTLVPVIGLVQVGRQSMADRYAYIPLIGLFIAVAWGLGQWAERRKQIRPATSIAVVALVACMALTWVQVGYWRNTETLFKHDLKVANYNYLACYNLAAYFVSVDKPDEALFYLAKAPVEHPADAERLKFPAGLAHFAVGEKLMEHGEFEKAADQMSQAVSLQPTNADWHLGLGKALGKQGKANEAMAEFAAAEKAEPDDPETQTRIAALLSQQHDIPRAVSHYHAAVRLYQKALQQNTNSPAIRNNLAWILATNPNAEIRNGPEAVTLARQACETTHWEHGILIGTLAAAYAETGQFDEAVNMARKAQKVALDGGHKEIAARNEELLHLYETRKPYREK